MIMMIHDDCDLALIQSDSNTFPEHGISPRARVPQGGFRSLADGEEVEFDVEEDAKNGGVLSATRSTWELNRRTPSCCCHGTLWNPPEKWSI